MRITLATVLALVVTALVAPAARAEPEPLVLTWQHPRERCFLSDDVVPSPVARVTRAGRPVAGLEVTWRTRSGPELADGQRRLQTSTVVTDADGTASPVGEDVVHGIDRPSSIADVLEPATRARTWDDTFAREAGTDLRAGTVQATSDVHFSERTDGSVSAPTVLSVERDHSCGRRRVPGVLSELVATGAGGATATIDSGELPSDGQRRFTAFLPGVGRWALRSRQTLPDGTELETPRKFVTVSPDVSTMGVGVRPGTRRSSWTSGNDGELLLKRGGRVAVFLHPLQDRPDADMIAALPSIHVAFTDRQTRRTRALPDVMAQVVGDEVVAVVDEPVDRPGRYRFDLPASGTATAATTSRKVRPLPRLVFPQRLTRVRATQRVHRTLRVLDGADTVVQLTVKDPKRHRTLPGVRVRVPASGKVAVTLPAYRGTRLVSASLFHGVREGGSTTQIARTGRLWRIESPR